MLDRKLPFHSLNLTSFLKDLEEQIVFILLKQERLIHQRASDLLIAKIRELRIMGKLHPSLFLRIFEARLQHKAYCHSKEAYKHYFEGGEKQHNTNQYCGRDTDQKGSNCSPCNLVRTRCIGMFNP